MKKLIFNSFKKYLKIIFRKRFTIVWITIKEGDYIIKDGSMLDRISLVAQVKVLSIGIVKYRVLSICNGKIISSWEEHGRIQEIYKVCSNFNKYLKKCKGKIQIGPCEYITKPYSAKSIIAEFEKEYRRIEDKENIPI